MALAAPIRAKSDVSELVGRLDSSRGAERLRLVAALGRSEEPDAAVPALLGLLDVRRGRPAECQAVARALGRLGDGRAARPLAEAWDHLASLKLRDELPPPVQALRAELVAALAATAGRSGASVLLAALGDDDEGVAAAAAAGLGRLRERAAIEPLVSALERGGELGRAAFEALGAIGDRRPAVKLKRFFRHDDARVRAQAAYALALLGDKDGKDMLRLLRGAEPPDRGAVLAGEYLARLGEDEGFEFLLGRIARGGSLRAAAVEAIGRVQDRRAISGLGEMLESPDPQARLAAVEGLRRIGGPKAAHALRRVLDDKNAAVAAAAAEALAEIEG